MSWAVPLSLLCPAALMSPGCGRGPGRALAGDLPAKVGRSPELGSWDGLLSLALASSPGLGSRNPFICRQHT